MYFVIAGPLASGKSTFAHALAQATGAIIVSFGTFVRANAQERGDGTGRVDLQRIGQELVEANPAQFLQGSMSHAGYGGVGPVVFDSVRHLEIWLAIEELAHKAQTAAKLLFVDLGMAVREQRIAQRGATLTELARWDAHRMEQEVALLKCRAHIVLDGAAPTSTNVSRVLDLSS